MLQTAVIDTIRTRFVFKKFFFLKIFSFMRQCGKTWQSPTGHIWSYNTTQKPAICMLDSEDENTET